MFGKNKPSPALAQLGKEQKEKQKDFDRRRDEMLKRMQEDSKELMVDVAGALDYRQGGIVPLVALIDARGRYEHIAKAKEEAEAKDPANRTLIV